MNKDQVKALNGMYLVEYSSNNSGGDWWLKDKDWRALDKAGWKVIWARQEFAYNEEGDYTFTKEGLPKVRVVRKSNSFYFSKKEGRMLGALSSNAFKKFKTLKEALEEFENITGQTITDEGCNCCGPPHSFSWDNFKGDRGDCSGEDCLPILFPDKKIPGSLRACVEKR